MIRTEMTLIAYVRHYLLREALDLLHPVRPARDDKLQGNVLDADVAICPERLYQLLGAAAQSTLVLGDGLPRHLDPPAACQLHLRRIASRFGSQAQGVLIPRAQFGRCDRHIVRKPRVPVLCRTSLRRAALSADPDRNARLLHRLGVEGQVLEAIKLAIVADVLLCPQAREDLELLICHAPTILERDAQRFKLLLHPADAYTHDQAAPGESLDGDSHACPVQGMAVWQH